MSAIVICGVVERAEHGLADEAAERHVEATRLVVRLADADDGAVVRAHEPSLQDADQVLLQARARGRVGEARRSPPPKMWSAA